METKKATLGVVVLSLVCLVGCQLPFSTGARVESYLKKTEPTFEENQEELNNLGDKLNTEDLDQENITENLELLEKMKDQAEKDQAKVEKVVAPTQTQDLRKKFDSYYQTELDILDNFIGLFQYFDDVQGYLTKPEKYSNQIQNLPSNANAMAGRLNNVAKDVQKDIVALKKIEANDLSKKFHKELLALYQALDDFLTGMARAVRTSNLSGITTASNIFDSSLSQVTSSFSGLNIKSKLSSYQNRYEKAEKEVLDEINRLKGEYNIE